MPCSKFFVGTRGSRLALAQTQIVIEHLKRFFPDFEFEIKVIKTTGDKFPQIHPLQFPSKGAFTKEIEEELLANRIDFAIHSLKDLPTELPDGLIISAFLERNSPEDVLISKNGEKLDELPFQARIGSSSLRRKIQLLQLRNDLEILPLRGNIDTRLRKLRLGDYDAIVVARVALERLGMENEISEVFPTNKILPAVGQGIIAIECNSENLEAIKLTKVVNHTDSELTALAERAFLRRIGGGCRNPIAGFAWISGEKIYLEGLVASVDGKHILRQKISSDKNFPEDSGTRLAEIMLENGAKDILISIQEN